jgi:hypothetical protein
MNYGGGYISTLIRIIDREFAFENGMRMFIGMGGQ